MKFYYFVILTELVKVPERVGKVGQDDRLPHISQTLKQPWLHHAKSHLT